MEELKFEQLPSLIADLKNEVKEMKSLLLRRDESHSESNNPIGINDVAVLTSLKVPTIYSYCQRNEIPYQKKGNRLYFFKSEIIDWIKEGNQKTIKELHEEVDELLKNSKKG